MTRSRIRVAARRWAVGGTLALLLSLTNHAVALTGAESMPPESFRFVAYVGDDYGYCTGAIIAPTWVLTAAHCVVHGDGSTIKPNEIGDLSRGWPDDDHERVPVKRVIAHPHYYWEGDGFRNDIALIETAWPFASSHLVPVAVLGPEDEALHAANGATAVLIGYGEDENGQRERQGLFRVVRATLYHADACRTEHAFVDPRDEIVHDRTICAGDRARGIRSGDSGGPLLVETENGYGVVGVASISGNDPTGYPVVAVYTRVATVKEWIDGCVNGTGECVEGGVSPPELKRYGPGQIRNSETLEFRATAVIFVNETERGISHYWIDFEGNEMLYGSMAPGESYSQHTYPGHAWVVKDAEAQTLGVFVAEREMGRAIVTGDLPIVAIGPDDEIKSDPSTMTDADFEELCNHVRAGNYAQIDRMVQAGADVNKRFGGHYYQVALHCAEDPRTLAYLVEKHGADPNGTMRDGEHLDTPVCMARTLEMAQEFVRLGAALRGRGDESQSLVECAAYYGNADMVEWWRTLERTAPETPTVERKVAPTEPAALLPELYREKIAQVLKEALSATMWNMHGEEVPDWSIRLRAVELMVDVLDIDAYTNQSPSSYTWERSEGDRIPNFAIIGGSDSDGEALFICRAELEGGIHPGKISSPLGGCNVPYGGKEIKLRRYEVMVTGSERATSDAK